MMFEIASRNGLLMIFKFRRAAKDIQDQIREQMYKVATDLVDYIKNEKLSGQVLNRKTGALADGIEGNVRVGLVNVLLEVSPSSVPYAGIHEFGGRTSPHVIRATKADLLRFIGRDGTVQFRKQVNHPGSNIPERSYMRSALTDKADDIKQQLFEAMQRGLQKDMPQ
jgi:phage gpG-like protein